MTLRGVDILVPPNVRDCFTETAINGQGGFQRLARRISDQLRQSPVLHLTSKDFTRIARYASVGKGGFQNRYARLVCAWVVQNADTLVR